MALGVAYFRNWGSYLILSQMRCCQTLPSGANWWSGTRDCTSHFCIFVKAATLCHPMWRFHCHVTYTGTPCKPCCAGTSCIYVRCFFLCKPRDDRVLIFFGNYILVFFFSFQLSSEKCRKLFGNYKAVSLETIKTRKSET